MSTTEVSGIENRWILFQTAPTIVQEKFEDGRSYASAALALANAVIEDLRQVGRTLNPIDTTTGINAIAAPVIGAFTGVAPTAPNTDVNFPTPPSDSDALQDAIKTKLLNDITNGVAAISETVETAIFERESERSLLVHQDNIDRISAEWAKRGFTLSNAILGQLLSQADIEFANKRLDVSRDIAIKNFELSDTNVKFAVQQGIAFNAYRVAVYTAQVNAEVARIEAIMRKYLGEAEVYKAEAQTFSALADVEIRLFGAEVQQEVIKAQLLIKNVEIDIENFKAENGLKLEADKAIGAINSQVVAGALASVNASVHISASDSGSYNFSSNPSF